MTGMNGLPLIPDDEANRMLVRSVHPSDWAAPEPTSAYHLVVVGGGPAGLVAALGAAGLGARVAIVEQGLLGGDCLNWGCVPSKALIASARSAHDARHARDFGVDTGQVAVDFGRVMERMRHIRASIAHHDSAERLRSANIHVFLGRGTFVARDSLEVDGVRLRFQRALIATGARAWVPPLPGLDKVRWVDNEGLFGLTELPRRLVVLGAGPIGVEMAQTFRRLGSDVTLVDAAASLLPREDPEASQLVQQAFMSEGIRLVLGAKVLRFEADDSGQRAIVEVGGERAIEGDVFLLAMGRRAPLGSLGLEAAGVNAGPRGIQVDDYLRTSNGNIYAAGDVAGLQQFTHAADAMARVVVQNALFAPTKRYTGTVVPWATYCDPEVAHVGPPYAELKDRADLTAIRVEPGGLDRFVCEGETGGLCKIWADKRGRVIAGTLVSRHAGDLAGELAVAVANGLTLGALSATVHAYPTRAEVFKRAGDAFNRARLTPGVAGWIRTFLRLRFG